MSKYTKDALAFVQQLNDPMQMKNFLIELCRVSPAAVTKAANLPAFTKKNKEQQMISFMRLYDKISSIKRYREVFKVGLKDAKDAVEELEVSYKITFGTAEYRINSQ